MFSQSFVQSMVDGLVVFATDLLLPGMIFAFFMAIVFRSLIYFTVSRHEWFTKEFEKRTNVFLEEEDHKKTVSFFVTAKKLLERTYYEIFEVRAIMKRRKPDYIMSSSDRFFLVNQGCAWLVRDLQKQIRHLRHGKTDAQPKLMQMTKTTLQNNPAFNKIFGVIPSAPINDVLNILPGIFIVAGIFGTFLGIMKALPELGTMDLANSEKSKEVMDQFLLKISFAMSTSLLGIMLSVALNFFNTLFSPDKKFVEIVERFENSLDLLWSRSDNNDLPDEIPEFDEHRDPIDALAEESINQELNKNNVINKKRVSQGKQLPPDPPPAQETDTKAS